MTIGVYCEKTSKKLSFEECIECSLCLPPQIIKSLRVYENKPKRNTYYVREIIGCLRKAYYKRKSPQDEFSSLRDLYCRKRGELFGAITGHGWNELDGSLQYDVDGEAVKLTARLDCYDPEKREIVELKSLENIDGNLPRTSDLRQIQSYATIFKGIIPVASLSIIYLSMNGFRRCLVGIVDNSAWLQERTTKLHKHIRDSKIPEEEPSRECYYCQHKTNCLALKAKVPIMINAPQNPNGRTVEQ